MEKLKLHTPDRISENVAKLAELFPSCVTESRDDKGNLTKSIDFDQLRQELSDRVVEGPRERYHLDWPGKREAILAANAPIAKTLRPCREESVDFDSTKNIFIEGDNLDALKLLQETYLGKVKMIYIDPPYNTGNDFIYDDAFAETAESYLARSNQQDEVGNRMVANQESNGRFHSDWLTMMYSRLRLAKNLLAPDGVIFVSCDDNEVHNVRMMMDEALGEKNFICTVIWEKADSPRNSARQFSEDHDFIVAYSRNPEWIPDRLPRTEAANSIYTNPDNDSRGPWLPGDPYANHPYSKGLYTITGPTGRTFSPPPGRFWRISEEKLNELNAEGRIWWGPNGSARPSIKRYLSEVGDLVPRTLWKKEDVGSNRSSKNELRELFPDAESFDTPKPTRLVERMLRLATGKTDDDLVLDFFAGSGTTAHAVLNLNLEDNGKRRFILVQLPEPTGRENYRTIADIAKERIRRAGTKIKAEAALTAPDLDSGFRVLKIDVSNMKDVFYTPDESKQGDLLKQIDNIREDRTPEDLLFQVLVDWGVDLALPIAQETIDGKTVFLVDGNALAACFDQDVTDDLVKEIAMRKPLRAVFRDSSYGSDSVKINVEQIFKLLSPGTELKSL